jgi:4-alpha-glucanotransferase
VDAAAWGIEPGYHDHRGTWVETRPDTAEALLQAMGADSEHPPATDDLRFARPGQDIGGRWDVALENGGELRVEDGRLPDDVPLGYHRIMGDDAEATLIVSPGRCFLPEGLRTWGWAVQLYAARSEESWGIGDLADARRLAQWSARQGAGMMLLNPLHASLPHAQTASPYFPSSRCFRNPVYLRVDGPMPAEAKDLNAERIIDRERVWALKRAALEQQFDGLGGAQGLGGAAGLGGFGGVRSRGGGQGLGGGARLGGSASLGRAQGFGGAHGLDGAHGFDGFGGAADFDAYVAEQGETLAAYATFCAIAEEHGGPWQEWPEPLRDRNSRAAADYAEQHRDRVRFHQWVQWQVDRQLRDAGQAVDLMQDLAIGCDPSGADTWLWPDAFAHGVRVGAPPDEFNTQGQDWGLPPFDPWRLRQGHYEPFIQTMRAGFRHAGGMRVDHVMGLFRLFWIPPGADARSGTYVRYPHHELLDILALESSRAGAYVVGEDLGTVADYMRAELSERDVLSYRLLWFEPNRPPQYPERALAAVTTHDLPTVAGMWSGSDLAEQERLGLEPNVEGTRAIHDRLQDWLGLSPESDAADVVVGAHRLLAQAPSAIVTATLDDALLVEERPNVPGTTDERPNWSLALPKPVEEIEADPLAARIADILNRR